MTYAYMTSFNKFFFLLWFGFRDGTPVLSHTILFFYEV